MKKKLANTVAESNPALRKEFVAALLPLMERLNGAARSMTRNNCEAEDLLQNTYLKAWRSYHTFKRGSNFEGWIFRILKNNLINLYRHKQRLPRREDFDRVCDWVAAEPPRPSAAEVFANPGGLDDYADILDDRVTAALDVLPKKYRHAVLLSDIGGLKYREIAALRDCPVGTVMSRIHRGRQTLARLLKSYAVEYGYV